MESSEPSVGHRLRKPGAVVEADYLPRPPTTPEVQDPAARPRPLALHRSGRVSSACCGAGPSTVVPSVLRRDVPELAAVLLVPPASVLVVASWWQADGRRGGVVIRGDEGSRTGRARRVLLV